MFQIIDQDDPFTLACLLAILYAIATHMASGAVRTWGKRVGGVSYVLFCIYATCVLEPADAADMVHIAFRGLFAAGMAVTVSWLALSIVVFCACAIRDYLTSLKASRAEVAPSPPMPEPVVEPPPQPAAPPPPRAVLLRQRAEAAQADYEAEIAALAGLPLDDDERETLVAIAKQRLIQRLNPGE